MPSRDDDRHAWAAAQAALLRAQRPSGIDWDNIADELTDIAAGAYRELEEHVTTVLTHMLLEARTPSRRSWASISERRKRAVRLLRIHRC